MQIIFPLLSCGSSPPEFLVSTPKIMNINLIINLISIIIIYIRFVNLSFKGRNEGSMNFI